MLTKSYALAFATLIVSSAAHAAAPAELEANKRVASAVMMALQHQDTAKAAALLDENYIQHNPTVPSGRAGFIAFFSAQQRSVVPGAGWINPPVLITAEDDIVQLTFRRRAPEPGQPGKTYDSFWWDTFRVRNGKVVEHWDPALKPGGQPGPRP